MGRQINYYMLNEENIAVVAQAISDAGYAMIKNGSVIPNDGISLYHETQSSALIKLCNPKFRETIELSDYTLEWLQSRVKERKKIIGRSRLYLNTSDFAVYRASTIDQLMRDYQRLSRIIQKLSPMQTIMLEDGSVRNRMDDATIQLLQEGYRLLL